MTEEETAELAALRALASSQFLTLEQTIRLKLLATKQRKIQQVKENTQVMRDYRIK